MSARFAALASQVVGRRVEVAPHLDAWMQGDRYGTVVRVTGAGMRVRMDRSGRTLTLSADGIGRWMED